MVLIPLCFGVCWVCGNIPCGTHVDMVTLANVCLNTYSQEHYGHLYPHVWCIHMGFIPPCVYVDTDRVSTSHGFLTDDTSLLNNGCSKIYGNFITPKDLLYTKGITFAKDILWEISFCELFEQYGCEEIEIFWCLHSLHKMIGQRRISSQLEINKRWALCIPRAWRFHPKYVKKRLKSKENV